MPSLAEPILHVDSQNLDLERVSIPISPCLALNVYSNTEPRNLEIAGLQKGLILTCNGKERVGEGTGFGFPVLVCPEETFFSGSANVRISKSPAITRIIKEFRMDRVARNKLGDFRLENRRTRALLKYLAELYQRNQRFRPLTFKKFMLKLGVEVAFAEIEPTGNVTVTYELHGNTIDVEVDLSQIKQEYRKKAFILNEQSASFFRKYSDSQNTLLIDGEVGAWDNVNAEFATFTDIRGRFGFRLWQVEGALLRRGRETLRDCYDWVGLDYEVNPRWTVFKYRVELLGANVNW